ncbi:MAG: hypothetical protein QOK16_3405 [Solirubrobacteraceae bacterium]|nr:hypothetical protein [Solirubrobacteraceae bacterium]
MAPAPVDLAGKAIAPPLASNALSASVSSWRCLIHVCWSGARSSAATSVNDVGPAAILPCAHFAPRHVISSATVSGGARGTPGGARIIVCPSSVRRMRHVPRPKGPTCTLHPSDRPVVMSSPLRAGWGRGGFEDTLVACGQDCPSSASVAGQHGTQPRRMTGNRDRSADGSPSSRGFARTRPGRWCRYVI